MDFGNFEVPGQVVLVAYGAFMLSIVGIILWTKNRFRQHAKSAENEETPTTFASKNKYPAIDALRSGGTFFNVGLIIAIGMVLLAFSWTQYEKEVFIPIYDPLTPEIAVNSPIVKEKLKPPPPPPPTKVEIAEDNEIPDTVVFEDPIFEPDFQPVIADEKPKAIAPPPPPPPPVVDVPPIFKVVEEMPMFKGCEEIEIKKERRICADQKMLEFIYSKIKYPAMARENGIEGTVVIRFIVNEDGSITNSEIVREIGAGCGNEALRVVNLMPNWNAGKQIGKAVKVQFNLPVKFKLQ